MKVSSQPLKQDIFKPFSLTINVESEEECIALFCLFNHLRILNILGINKEAEVIRDEIQLRQDGMLPNYLQQFSKLESIIRN